MRRSNSRKTTILLVVAIAFGSYFGAVGLWLYLGQTGVGATTNRGELLAPGMTLADLRLTDGDGLEFRTEGLWWIVTVDAGGCCDECVAAQQPLKQLQVLLNKDAARVRRAVVVSTRAEIASSDEFATLSWLLGAPGLDPGVYIVDPLGNLVLRYRFEQAGEPVLKDLRRLLKVSQIG